MFRFLVHFLLVTIVAVLAIFYFGEFFVYFGEPVFIDSHYGRLRGRVTKVRGGQQVYAFTSIPYAKPPVDDLRFGPPEPFGKWAEDEILDATKPVKLCLQYETLWKKIVGVEDCLQLHVYTPNLDTEKPLLPVMVWFHGGHFMFGGNDIYGPDYLLEGGDVVLVTVNYRLGALGFLNTGDEVVTGNQGLKDQSLALKWIKRAIKDFGGDPEKVTLFGCSAGGASVNYHMVSPMSKDLFHRAISQSGSNLCPWAFTRDPKTQSRRLAGQLNCTAQAAKSSTSLVNCLRKKTATEIVSVHEEILDVFHDVDAIFGPTIENVAGKTKASLFLTESPYKLYKAGKFNRVPWVTGVTSEEGCFRTCLILPNQKKMTQLNKAWTSVAPKTLLLYNDDPKISELVRQFYFGGYKSTNAQTYLGWEDLEGLTDMYSDRYFVGCVRDAAVLHSVHAPVHIYYYTHKPEMGYGYISEMIKGHYPNLVEVAMGYLKFLFIKNVLKEAPRDYGVCHTDDLQYLFQLSPLLAIHEQSPDYKFSREMVKVWVRFAATGDPGEFNGVKWTPLELDKATNKTVEPLQYLRIGKVPMMMDEPFTTRLKFWESLNLPRN